MSKDNYFKAMCHGVCEAKQLDAAVLVTVKTDREKDIMNIEIHGDGPNKQAVEKTKAIVLIAFTEIINKFNEERAKSKREATNAD